MISYKIMVYTIQGQLCFFCHWKMGNSYSTRLVSHRNDAIWYTESEVNNAEKYLKNNLEKLQVKSYTVDEVTYKPDSVKAQKRPYTRIFGQNARNIERNGAIL